jgi:hypothetical protein
MTSSTIAWSAIIVAREDFYQAVHIKRLIELVLAWLVENP